MPAKARILVCIPRGGLNDTLCQIETCRRYARKFGRTLFIDTTRSGLMADFSTFFEFTPCGVEIVPAVTAEMTASFNTMECRPAQMTGRLGAYSAPYSQDVANHVDSETGARLSFDFSTDHDEPVLLHEQCGGGSRSEALMRRLRFSPNVAKRVHDALRDIPAGYIGIHVRNTDYRTDYEGFIDSLGPQLKGKRVLICSDNPAAREFAKSRLSASTVFSVTKLPETGGKPLHDHDNYTRQEERAESTIISLIDLMALGQADKVHYTTVTGGFTSGFSRLARFISKNRSVVDSLLYHSGGRTGDPERRRDAGPFGIHAVLRRLAAIAKPG